MPSAANGDVDKYIPIYNAENSPIRRMVEVLQGKIASLEKQRSKLTSGGKVTKDASSGEPKANCSMKLEELNQMLEFVWDLCKQAMGIAIWSENEAKKQARKESAMRKSEDIQLVRDVLLVLDCLEQLNDPTTRQDFLAGEGGAPQLTQEDLRVLDDIYPEITPKHCPEEGEPSFDEQTTSAAKHLIAILDRSTEEVIGSTYAHIKQVVDTVHTCGYLDHSKEVPFEIIAVEESVEVLGEPELLVEEPEYVPPPQESPTPQAPPPPAPQAVPAPTFPILPPNAPPVTLQQVEHAYFAQQYGHPQKPPIPEVFSPLNFIFLQESEIDTPEPAQPSSRSVTPNSIPSQTFTNQNFSIPGQHFSPNPEPHLPPLPTPGAPHYPQEVPPTHFQGGNAPPIPLAPLGIPPYPQNLPYKVPHTTHPHHPQPPTPTEIDPPQTEDRIPSPVHQVNKQDADYSEWNIQAVSSDQTTGTLEISEWNSADHKTEESESGNHSDGQSNNRFRSRGRGGRSGSGGGYRGRGGYQNGGRSNGNFYRNNSDGYQNRNDDNSYRENGNHQGGYKGSREGRGGWSRREGGMGNNKGGGGARRGGPPRGEGGSRGQYQRKGTNSHYSSETKQNAQ